MYELTKLTQQSMSFINYINSSGSSRSKQVSISIAKAISDSLPIPTSPVEDIKSFFKSNHEMSMLSTISKLNEMVVIDIVSIQDYAARFYETRYMLANAKLQTLAFKKETAVEDYFGISKIIPSDIIDTIKEDPNSLTVATNGFATVISELSSM